jgi:membrane protein YdbS with pleckstrin-like domain
VIEATKAFVLRACRVPARPHLPAGDPRSARVFRAGLNFWRLRLARWGLSQVLTLAGVLFMIALLHAGPRAFEWNQPLSRVLETIDFVRWMTLLRVIEILSVATWLLQMPLTLAVARLDYEMRWYVVTDRAARLREGVLKVKEMTFTLANVQDIRLRQNPLQRLLGLADVELRTAGGSEAPAEHTGQVENLHLARFGSVDADTAEVIRDLVRERIRLARAGAGLGDPEDRAEPIADAGAALRAACEEAVRESAALRAAAERIP